MLKLFYLHFAVKGYEWLQQYRVKRLFYKDPYFRSVDRALMRGPNPYRLKEAFPYGETPLCSLKQIADRCGLKKEDCFVDLGCGRGRGVFFAAHLYGCRAHGIDKMQSFIDSASELAQEYQVPRVAFSCGDLLKFNFSQATFVYFYGTTFSDEFVQELSKGLKAMPKNGTIVTVSEPLEGFQLKDQFMVSFPWGKGEVFVHTT